MRELLVMRLGNNLVSPDLLCNSCLLATQDGKPRWRNGQLKCGQPINIDNVTRFRCINGADEIIEIFSPE